MFLETHIITTASGQGKQLKCLHCNGFSRLKLKGGLTTFATELDKFSQVHSHCQPKVDGRSLRYTKPTAPIKYKPMCLACGRGFKRGDGKVPFYRYDQLKAFYAHPECADKVSGYEIGHHNIIVESDRTTYGESWLYFWRGECAAAKNKAEAESALRQIVKASGVNVFVPLSRQDIRDMATHLRDF